MIGKPELPGLARDMEIKHALTRMSPRKSGKSSDTPDQMKARPGESR